MWEGGWRVGFKGFCWGEGRSDVTQGVEAKVVGGGEGGSGFVARRGAGAEGSGLEAWRGAGAGES